MSVRYTILLLFALGYLTRLCGESRHFSGPHCLRLAMEAHKGCNFIMNDFGNVCLLFMEMVDFTEIFYETNFMKC